MSAPQTEPAPEKQSRRVKVLGAAMEYVLAAKTGRKTSRGMLSSVMEKASTMSEVHGAFVCG